MVGIIIKCMTLNIIVSSDQKSDKRTIEETLADIRERKKQKLEQKADT